MESETCPVTQGVNGRTGIDSQMMWLQSLHFHRNIWHSVIDISPIVWSKHWKESCFLELAPPETHRSECMWMSLFVSFGQCFCTLLFFVLKTQKPTVTQIQELCHTNFPEINTIPAYPVPSIILPPSKSKQCFLRIIQCEQQKHVKQESRKQNLGQNFTDWRLKS